MNKGTGWWELNAPPNMQSVTSPDEFSSAMESRLAAGEAVVVDFFAPWCRACRSLYPKLTQIAGRNPDIHFVKFNVEPESLRELSEKMGVDRLPYFHFYKGKQGLVSHFTANLNPAQLQKLRTEICNLQK
jgi:thiol-disulfide isomerase/thioredoxin